MQKIDRSFSVSLAAVSPNDRIPEAVAALNTAKRRIDEAVRREMEALAQQFPPGDFAQDPSQRKGCCGE